MMAESVLISGPAESRTVSSAGPALVRNTISSHGQPLDAETRGLMEPRFGFDLTRVRVHTDARSAESALAIGALAYTTGQHVVFAPGRFRPDSREGRHLLAHELTHVVQQSWNGAMIAGRLAVSSPSDAAELEAERSAESISAGRAVRFISAGPLKVSRVLGISLPTGVRSLALTELSLLSAIYKSSIDYPKVILSDATGASGRPFTMVGPSGTVVINVGTAAYASPASNPRLLIHEMAHVWQSQHHPDRGQFMINSVESQAAAAIVGGDSYCYIPGKAFGLYAAEQIAESVENGEPAIISHMASAAAGVPDLQNILSLSLPRWETRGAPGVRC
jgi:Domain of unknown function (DUF4157)